MHEKVNLQMRFLFSMSIPAIGSSNTRTDESAIRAIAEVNQLLFGSVLLNFGQKRAVWIQIALLSLSNLQQPEPCSQENHSHKGHVAGSL